MALWHSRLSRYEFEKLLHPRLRTKGLAELCKPYIKEHFGRDE